MNGQKGTAAPLTQTAALGGAAVCPFSAAPPEMLGCSCSSNSPTAAAVLLQHAVSIRDGSAAPCSDNRITAQPRDAR